MTETWVGPEVQCVQCGKTFIQSKVSARRGSPPHCSRVCAAATARSFKSAGSRKPDPVTKTCLTCGTEFQFVPLTRGHRGLYCSRACYGKAPRPSGPDHPAWKGGHVRKRDGYRSVYHEGRLVQEHRLVMERHLGRPLGQDETVHHINGDKADNRIENLELWTSRHPRGQRVTDLVAFAREILALYGDEVARL